MTCNNILFVLPLGNDYNYVFFLLIKLSYIACIQNCLATSEMVNISLEKKNNIFLYNELQINGTSIMNPFTIYFVMYFI